MTGEIRRPGGQRHAARLRALGSLLTSKGYIEDGLAIVAVGDGFAVTGLRRTPQPQSDRLRFSLRREAPPPPPPPTLHAETITAAEIAAEIAELER